jgi:hypothetical protein
LKQKHCAIAEIGWSTHEFVVVLLQVCGRQEIARRVNAWKSRAALKNGEKLNHCEDRKAKKHQGILPLVIINMLKFQPNKLYEGGCSNKFYEGGCSELLNT